MSSAVENLSEEFPAPDPKDRFFYGSRYVRKKLPSGRTKIVQVPLTEYDVLHPKEGDHIVNGEEHELVRAYLRAALIHRYRNEPSTAVLSDTAVYWTPKFHHCPDIAVIFGADPAQQLKRRSYRVFKEKAIPTVLMEVVSRSTRKNDLVKKLEQYATTGVRFYVILDRRKQSAPLSIQGYEFTPEGTIPMPLDERGWLWLEALGLWLGLSPDGKRAILYDGVTGEPIKDYDDQADEIQKQADEIQKRARQIEDLKKGLDAKALALQAEKARADALEAKLKELEAKNKPQ